MPPITMTNIQENWETEKAPLDSPLYDDDEYSPSSPTEGNTQAPAITQEPAITHEHTRAPFSTGIRLNGTGSSLRDIWATYHQQYSSMSDMLTHAAQDENVSVVLYSTRKKSLPDDVWRVKEYLRSFDNGRTSVAAVREHFPLISDLQWTTLREQSEFVIDRRSNLHTMGLQGMQRTKQKYVPPERTTRRKTRRSDTQATVQRVLHTSSGPMGKSELVKETNLSRGTISDCLDALMTGHNPAVYEFMNGSDRTYGLVKK